MDFPKTRVTVKPKEQRKLNMYELPTITGRNDPMSATPASWYKKPTVGGPDMDTMPKKLSGESKTNFGNIHGQMMPAVMNTRKRGFSF